MRSSAHIGRRACASRYASGGSPALTDRDIFPSRRRTYGGSDLLGSGGLPPAGSRVSDATLAGCPPRPRHPPPPEPARLRESSREARNAPVADARGSRHARPGARSASCGRRALDWLKGDACAVIGVRPRRPDRAAGGPRPERRPVGGGQGCRPVGARTRPGVRFRGSRRDTRVTGACGAVAGAAAARARRGRSARWSLFDRTRRHE